MEVFAGLVFLAIIFGLLNIALRYRLIYYFYKTPRYFFLVPWALTMFVCAVAAAYSATNPNFRYVIPLIFAYTFIPVFILYNRVSRQSQKLAGPSWIDFLVILMLWLPVEIATGRGWLNEYFQRSTHIVAFGTAVAMGLFLFLTFRRISGIKYRLPRRLGDFIAFTWGLFFAICILIPFGLWIGFLAPFHIPANFSVFSMTVLFLAILVGVALPEEILFRGLIQNWLMQKFGPSHKMLAVAALIFGLSHLNNFSRFKDGTIVGSPPNWEYAAIATLAGLIYGKVFQKSSSIFSSVILHAAVNTIRNTLFAGGG